MLEKEEPSSGAVPITKPGSAASNGLTTSITAASGASTSATASADETLYLCNFRVSVDGDWLCLKEVEEEIRARNAAVAEIAEVERKLQRTIPPPDTLAITPELERLATIYPNYPVGPPRGILIHKKAAVWRLYKRKAIIREFLARNNNKSCLLFVFKNDK